MKHIRNWGCKVKYILKFTIQRFWKIIENVLALLGIILTAGECVLLIFNSNIIYTWMHDYVIWILGSCIIISFWKNKVQLNYEYFLKGTDVKINLQVSDVLNAKAAIVIPTNTTFDTKMEDEFISVSSVQGQFQKKFFANNIGTLDNLIEKGLEGYSYEKVIINFISDF